MSLDREQMLAELREIMMSTPETAVQRWANDVRSAELRRALDGMTGCAVNIDRILGSRPELPRPEEPNDELWRGDPMLRYMHETGEDQR